MPVTSIRQIAESAIETALAIINESGEIKKDRARKLIHALEVDLAAIEESNAPPLLEIDGEVVAFSDLVAAYLKEAYPNEHAYRVRDPGDFQSNSFRRKTLPKSEGGKGGVVIIIGRLKGQTTTTTQAYRFPLSLYTAAEAKQWLRDNDVKGGKFEAATGEKKEAAVEVSEVIRKQGDMIVLFDSEGKKELQRFEFGAGKKYEDEEKAREAAKKREGQIQFFKRESEAYIEEIAGSLSDIEHMVTEAFHAKFSPADRFEGPYRTRDVFMDNPTQGTSVIVWEKAEGKLWSVPYTTGDNGIEFASRDEWREVVHTYRFVDVEAAAAECDISESADFSVRAVEIIQEDGAHVIPELGARSPVIIKAQAIEPGLGNKRDMNYYGAEMLRRCGPKVFSGVDVFVTNHKEGEKTDPHKIGRFREVVGFSETGAPISEVVIYDPAYAEKTRARAAADQLETMEFSIHAKGTARKGVMDGTKCNIVEEITEVQSIDLVGKAGAGGRALGLAESAGGSDMTEETKKKDIEEVAEGARDIAIEEQGDPKPAQEAQPQDEPKPVTAERVEEMLTEADVPQRFHKWIERGTYSDEAAVTEAIAEAQKDATELTEAGKPFGLGPVDHAAITESRTNLEAAYAEIEKRHGVVPLAG